MNWILLVLAAAMQGLACPFANSNSPSPHSHARRSTSWNPFYTNKMTPDQWASLRATLSEYIQTGNGPFFVHQAYGDSVTGGGNHAQRWIASRVKFEERELAMMDSLMAKFPDITRADLISFAGAVSVSAMGGPIINWRPGRNDAKDIDDAPIDMATAAAKGSDGITELRAFFTARLGFSDRDIVALMGGHNLGNCHVWKSGYAGPWSSNPLAVTNEYFRLLQYPGNYTTQTVTSSNDTKTQWIDNSGRMMLPVDMSLTTDSVFYDIVKEYAASQSTYFGDFASAYGRLLEMNLATGLSQAAVSTSLASAVAQTALPADSVCYPNTGNPILCVQHVDNGKGDTIFTVHSTRQGWVGLGVGSGSMHNNDVIVGYTISGSGSGFDGIQTSRFTTLQHKIFPNTKSSWQQIPLHVASDKPSWSKMSFSAVHRKVIEPSTGLVGNDLNGYITFAISDFPPDGNKNVVDGVTSLYQHDISAVLAFGTGKPTMIVNSEPVAASMSTGVIAGIAAGAAVLVIAVIALVIVFRKRAHSSGEKDPKPVNASKPEFPQTLEEPESGWMKSESVIKSYGSHSVGSSSSAGDSQPPSFLPEVTLSNATTFSGISEKQSQLFHSIALPRSVPESPISTRMNYTALDQSAGSLFSANEAAENATFELQLKQYLGGFAAVPEDPLTWNRAAVAHFVMKNGGNLVSAARVRDENFVGSVLLAPTITTPDLMFELGIERIGDKVIFTNAMTALRERVGIAKDLPAYMSFK
ncbi:heme peroxidase [Chytriomyces cf. hyalinus JEL632]|nr:heme peroxidase [Chytriomyces cf. hyalinus JEL632]